MVRFVPFAKLLLCLLSMVQRIKNAGSITTTFPRVYLVFSSGLCLRESKQRIKRSKRTTWSNHSKQTDVQVRLDVNCTQSTGLLWALHAIALSRVQCRSGECCVLTRKGFMAGDRFKPSLRELLISFCKDCTISLWGYFWTTGSAEFIWTPECLTNIMRCEESKVQNRAQWWEGAPLCWYSSMRLCTFLTQIPPAVTESKDRSPPDFFRYETI